VTSLRILLTAGFRSALILALLAIGVEPLPAQNFQRIAAVVNDDVISVFDLDQRMTLVMSTSGGAANNAELRRRLQPQVMRTLIDERLQMQEAQRISATVTDKEIEEAVGRIEKANNMAPGALYAELDRSGTGRTSLQQQIKATLAWNKVITRRLRPTLQIGDDEVDDILARINASKGSTEYLLAEMFLSVETPDQEDEVRQRMEELLDQMRHGSSFAAMAQQFSQAASASVGGDIGWIERGQLDDDVAKALDGLQRNSATEPLRTPSGFYIYLLRDKRVLAVSDPNDAKVTLAQLVLPLEPDSAPADIQTQKDLAQTVKETVTGCDDLKHAAEELHVDFSDPTANLRIGDLNPTIRPTVADLKVGEASDPLQNDSGVTLLMVCERKDAPSNLPSREDLQENLTRQRLDLIARRYLRDLRRNAFIDIRV
jgi:peptidyl-prolyl cis-trans isomerase SurA